MNTPDAFPTDVTDDELAFVVPYLTLMTPEAPQREHDLRALLRVAAGCQAQPTTVILDGRTLQSTPESGARAGYDGAKRRKGSKVHSAVETLGNLLAAHVTSANEQERAQVETLAEAVQEVTGQQVELAYADQGYTGEQRAADAAKHGIELTVVKLPEAKRGFVLVPRRWVVERRFGWSARFRRLAQDYERLPEALTGLHIVVLACLLLHRAAALLAESASHAQEAARCHSAAFLGVERVLGRRLDLFAAHLQVLDHRVTVPQYRRNRVGSRRAHCLVPGQNPIPHPLVLQRQRFMVR